MYRFLLIILVFLIGISSYMAYGVRDQTQLGPTQLRASPQAIVGRIGSVPVRIPYEYAHLVEYDKDPNFMVTARRAPSSRTYESSIRSFYFDAHFPDMSGQSKYGFHRSPKDDIFTSTWISIAIAAGENYGGNDKLDNAVSNLIKLNRYKFEEAPGLVYGLVSYRPVGLNAVRRPVAGYSDAQDYNIYIHKGGSGDVDVYVKCSNVAHAAASCSMNFLVPRPMQARVTVQFRVGLLKSWAAIHDSTLKLIQSFAFYAPIP